MQDNSQTSIFDDLQKPIRFKAIKRIGVGFLLLCNIIVALFFAGLFVEALFTGIDLSGEVSQNWIYLGQGDFIMLLVAVLLIAGLIKRNNNGWMFTAIVYDFILAGIFQGFLTDTNAEDFLLLYIAGLVFFLGIILMMHLRFIRLFYKMVEKKPFIIRSLIAAVAGISLAIFSGYNHLI